MLVAILLAAVLALLVVFQLALALGAPWGRLAWGGQHAGVLPRGYRIGSAVTLLVYAAIGMVPLDLAGVIDVLPNGVALVLAWVIFAVFALSLVLNAISRSKLERAVMTPVASVLTVLAFLVALAGPVARTFEGTVLDDGDGPVLCTVVMESYPPQCPADSSRIAGWTWTGAPEESQGIRWGVYRFDGVRDGGTIALRGAPEPMS